MQCLSLRPVIIVVIQPRNPRYPMEYLHTTINPHHNDATTLQCILRLSQHIKAIQCITIPNTGYTMNALPPRIYHGEAHEIPWMALRINHGGLIENRWKETLVHLRKYLE